MSNLADRAALIVREELQNRRVRLVQVPVIIRDAQALARSPRATWPLPRTEEQQVVVATALALRRLSGLGATRARARDAVCSALIAQANAGRWTREELEA
jgi:hypothetical protein